MNEEYSYIFYTFFKNLQEMKEKPPWCLFEVYHMYGLDFITLVCWYSFPQKSFKNLNTVVS